MRRPVKFTSLLFVTLLAISTYSDAKDAGFAVGFRTEAVDVYTGSAVRHVNVTIWYPTSSRETAQHSYQTVIVNSELGFPVPGGSPAAISIPSPFLAQRDAAVKPGRYPLILKYSGGGNGDHLRLRNIPNNELLASRGFIVVETSRDTSNAAEQNPLLSGVITHMLEASAVRGFIHEKKIAVRGVSFGAMGVLSLLGGDQYGNAPDSRVQAAIIDEGIPAPCDFVSDCMDIKVPVMIRGGSRTAPPGTQGGFDEFINAVPRYLVTLDSPTHLSFDTGTCALIEAQRSASVDYQTALNGAAVDPRNLAYLGTGFVSGDTAGFNVSLLWNFEFFLFNVFNINLFGIGSGGDFCQSQHGGPSTTYTDVDLTSQQMIETLAALEEAFFKSAMGKAQGLVEKTAQNLDTVSGVRVAH